MSEKKVEEIKIINNETDNTMDPKFEKLFQALIQSQDQIKTLTKELTKIKSTVEAVPRLEALEDFKQLNGREDRFKEIIKLADIDITNKETRKDAMMKALEKYPEFRKVNEAGFTRNMEESNKRLTRQNKTLESTLELLGY